MTEAVSRVEMLQAFKGQGAGQKYGAENVIVLLGSSDPSGAADRNVLHGRKRSWRAWPRFPCPRVFEPDRRSRSRWSARLAG